MNTIRGFDWVFYGDGTDSGQHSIERITVEDAERSVWVELDLDCQQAVIQAIQENSVIYAQAAEGLYKITYRCSFKYLDSSSFPPTQKRFRLDLVKTEFLVGVTTHDKIIN
ncbi:hypothetical protein YOLOSWAG_14 [Erwinia phage vB_EamM_Yoloswag]|uniref:Uncharacterized protein n=1 Tax=Erwinia phage vB_EamM_Yoloswag TaxID=1958956 RepID=A0A1S6L2U6_9CAUD|nr:hypothetical protein HOR66_gp014 [Erwinia phage vB_EamM_Yoloswag]AQT28501.1 hypothetical protein YOLOSWAG_14 [Erwinia phage vB_EamM_Yoloswag]